MLRGTSQIEKVLIKTGQRVRVIGFHDYISTKFGGARSLSKPCSAPRSAQCLGPRPAVELSLRPLGASMGHRGRLGWPGTSGHIFYFFSGLGRFSAKVGPSNVPSGTGLKKRIINQRKFTREIDSKAPKN